MQSLKTYNIYFIVLLSLNAAGLTISWTIKAAYTLRSWATESNLMRLCPGLAARLILNWMMHSKIMDNSL